MATSTEAVFDSDVLIRKLEIQKPSSGTKITLFPTPEEGGSLFNNLVIKEGMFQPALSGSVTIREPSAIGQEFNFTGNEILHLEIETPGVDNSDQVIDFYIHDYKLLGDEVAATETRAAPGRNIISKWALEFTSAEYYYLDNQQLTYSENDFYGKIVGDDGLVDTFADKYFNPSANDFSTAQEDMDIEETVNSIWLKSKQNMYPWAKTVGFPSLIQLMNDLAENAVSANNPYAVNYLFWQDMKRWRFRSIDSLISEQKKPVAEYEVTIQAENNALFAFHLGSEASHLHHLKNGAYKSYYELIKPSFDDPYFEYIDFSSMHSSEIISYNYHDDYDKWESIEEYPLIPDSFIEDFDLNISSRKNYDFYGYFSEQYNDPDPKEHDPLGELSSIKQDKLWQTMFDQTELDINVKRTIHENIKGELQSRYQEYIDMKNIKEKWEVYECSICCLSGGGSTAEVEGGLPVAAAGSFTDVVNYDSENDELPSSGLQLSYDIEDEESVWNQTIAEFYYLRGDVSNYLTYAFEIHEYDEQTTTQVFQNILNNMTSGSCGRYWDNDGNEWNSSYDIFWGYWASGEFSPYAVGFTYDWRWGPTRYDYHPGSRPCFIGQYTDGGTVSCISAHVHGCYTAYDHYLDGWPAGRSSDIFPPDPEYRYEVFCGFNVPVESQDYIGLRTWAEGLYDNLYQNLQLKVNAMEEFGGQWTVRKNKWVELYEDFSSKKAFPLSKQPTIIEDELPRNLFNVKSIKRLPVRGSRYEVFARRYNYLEEQFDNEWPYLAYLGNDPERDPLLEGNHPFYDGKYCQDCGDNAYFRSQSEYWIERRSYGYYHCHSNGNCHNHGSWSFFQQQYADDANFGWHIECSEPMPDGFMNIIHPRGVVDRFTGEMNVDWDPENFVNHPDIYAIDVETDKPVPLKILELDSYVRVEFESPIGEDSLELFPYGIDGKDAGSEYYAPYILLINKMPFPRAKDTNLFILGQDPYGFDVAIKTTNPETHTISLYPTVEEETEYPYYVRNIFEGYGAENKTLFDLYRMNKQDEGSITRWTKAISWNSQGYYSFGHYDVFVDRVNSARDSHWSNYYGTYNSYYYGYNYSTRDFYAYGAGFQEIMDELDSLHLISPEDYENSLTNAMSAVALVNDLPSYSKLLEEYEAERTNSYYYGYWTGNYYRNLWNLYSALYSVHEAKQLQRPIIAEEDLWKYDMSGTSEYGVLEPDKDLDGGAGDDAWFQQLGVNRNFAAQFIVMDSGGSAGGYSKCVGHSCANPEGPVSKSGCPDDFPWCNCPMQELIPRDEAGEVIPKPTASELEDIKKTIRECELIESELGEEWLGCIWKDPNNISSCNCPNIGSRFKEYMEYLRTYSTYWNTPKYTPLYRMAQMSLIKSQTANAVVAGDFSRRPGDIIKITNSQETDQKYSEKRGSGKWMIAEINHVIDSPSNHLMGLTLIRDSNPVDPNESTEPTLFGKILG
tara:strand:- start:8566 stop:12939 length:4374 start_codon:yes stop_codon:yes gene_type:complete